MQRQTRRLAAGGALRQNATVVRIWSGGKRYIGKRTPWALAWVEEEPGPGSPEPARTERGRR